MTRTEKITFFQKPEFNSWLIASFFTILVAGIFAALPVIGAQRLGTAVDEELNRYDVPAERTIEASEPEPTNRPMDGTPVALRSKRTGP